MEYFELLYRLHLESEEIKKIEKKSKLKSSKHGT